MKFPRKLFLFTFFLFLLQTALAGEGTIEAQRAKYLPAEEKVICDNVVIKYEDYEVRGDKAILNLSDNTGTIEGNATLVKGGEVLKGEKLILDWEQEKWQLKVGKVEITPERLQGAQEPLFLYAEQTEGSSQSLEGVKVSLTTCNLPHPHYYVEAKELYVFFGNKLIAKDISLVVLGKRIFRLPYLVIPLKTPSRSSFIPQVGSDPYEGFFIKTAYPFISTAVASGILKIDYIERTGIGQGIEHTLNFPNLKTSLSLYHLSPKGNEGESWASAGKFNWEKGVWRFDLTSNFQKNSLWYGGSSRTSSWDASIGQTTSRGNLNLNFRMQDISGFYTSRSSYTNLLYSYQLKNLGNLRLNIEGSNLEYEGTPSDKELRSTFSFTQQGKIGFEINATRRYDLDGDSYPYDTNFFFLEKMPEIKLKASQFISSFPLDIDIALGKYRQVITKPFLSRGVLSVSTSWRFPKQTSKSRIPSLNFNGEFFQGIYGDGTALYSYSLYPSLQLPLGPSTFSLSFRHIVSRGYSPFYMDQVSPYSNINANWSLQKGSHKFSLQGGYDFRNDYPFTITGTIELSPPGSNLRIYLGYEPRSKMWRDIIANILIGDKMNPVWNVNIRYATEENRLALCRGMGRIEIGRWWRLEGFFGYNGYTGRVDELDLALTRDLHCWVASLLYNKRRKEFSFNIYLKAFPLQMRTLGVGGQGEYFGTNVGTYY
ncbi:LPS-assembly protein LptD [bacterium]|nr:LPS-assembly protein LptD [bacterium]